MIPLNHGKLVKFINIFAIMLAECVGTQNRALETTDFNFLLLF
jgi:hypothetical protein